MPKNTYKLLLKHYPDVTSLECLFRNMMQIFVPRTCMANQSKLQLSLLEMEQHNLLLIAIGYKFMQLKNVINKEKQETASKRSIT